MTNSIEITKIHHDSFITNVYTAEPFRMIGLIDVNINYSFGIERVTLAYYRSSGRNSGKIKGLWYPIVGIKTRSGEFTEFTNYLNYVLTNTTKSGRANDGWLAKSLFFSKVNADYSQLRGFSNGKHRESLLDIGKTLRDLYENNQYRLMKSLDARELNWLVVSKNIYHGNKYSQRENFEKFIQDIYNETR